MSLTASRPCLSSHTGSSPGCKPCRPTPRLASPVTAALWATEMSMPSTSLSCEKRSCWVLSVSRQAYTGKPTQTCSGSDVSHQRWGEASPCCIENEEAEASGAFWNGEVRFLLQVSLIPSSFSVGDVPASRQGITSCYTVTKYFSKQGGVLLWLVVDHVFRLSKKWRVWTPEGSDAISRFPGRRSGLCLCKLRYHPKPLVSRELAKTRRWHLCSDSQKGNVKACISLHPQSLMDICSEVKFISAQLICNYRQVRLSRFAINEK